MRPEGKYGAAASCHSTKPLTSAVAIRMAATTSNSTPIERTMRASPEAGSSVMTRTLATIRARGTNVPIVHPSVDRVVAALRAGGVAAEVREFSDSTRTAVDAAAALDVPVGAIVKSLVFAADGAPVLVLASGDHQVDTTKVAGALGAEHVGRADADLVRAATGFAIGGVAPVGHPQPLRTVIDTHLASFDVIWAAAGTPNTVFGTSYAELARVTDALAVDVAAGP